MSAKEVTSELGRIWREDVKENESASDKYVKLSLKDKKRYEKEKAEWDTEQYSSEDIDEVKAFPKVKSGTDEESANDSSHSDSGLPNEEFSGTDVKKTKKSKKTKTAFSIFCQKNRSEMRKEFPDLSIEDITKKMRTIWDTMDDEEQNAYLEE